MFKAGVKNVAKRAAQVTTEKVGQKVGETVAEKGTDKIQQILRKRPSQDLEKKLQKILLNRVPEKNCIKGRSVERRYVETKSNFSKRNLISSSPQKSFFTFIYRSFRSPQCSGHHNILRKLNASKSIWIPH